jgi:Tol biopolymer transport system component
VRRVTRLPKLFKDNVSLSHDRTMIAFHGTEKRNDTKTYEIYTTDIDGSNLTQLTNNIILDGHPAWSLDCHDFRKIYERH